uniref:EIF-4F 25 kDa subunit n=1 Tax=Glossina brevipalpis TaxID=37001 RepID=A0A1A9WX14_9MUSC
MFQSDFQRQKNFANPNLFNNSNPPKENGPAAQPVPAVDHPDDTKEENKEQEQVRTEHMLKHPFQNTWTLWYLENDGFQSWLDMQTVIMSFNNAEDFWSLYNHIKPPSYIKIGSDYSQLKEAIRPMWEDAANKEGGRWVITLNYTPETKAVNLWLDVILYLIGGVFDHSDQICGAVVDVSMIIF